MFYVMNTVVFWIKNARPIALPQSMLPAVLAICIASSFGGFSLPLGLLAIVGVVFGHLGLNLFDDYFDYRKKDTRYRNDMVHKGFRARISKCAYLTSGKATIHQLLIVCCIFSVIALLIGTIILYFRGTGILYFMVLTAVLGVSYSGAPLRLSYRGLGEPLIGFVFGPMVMSGVFFASCGHINETILLISVPVGLFVANILFVHSIMDFEPDKEIGKQTLAVLLNNKKLMMAILFIILFAPYAILLFGILNSYVSGYFGLSFITLPIAIWLYYMMIEFVYNPERKFYPRFWMGPMSDWNRIQAVGIDWFMIRWLLARNLMSMFCLTLMLISFIA